jgi:hypothetical protein
MVRRTKTQKKDIEQYDHPVRQLSNGGDELMKTVRDACTLQLNALSITLSDQIEQLNQR